MRTFRRNLVVTPLLIAMALTALGLPASAQAVYQQNTSQACCAAQACCADETKDEPGPGTDQGCCPEAPPGAARTECCPEAGADRPQCAAECETAPGGASCVRAESSRPGPQSATGCCP
jgi:hypothetical protein